MSIQNPLAAPSTVDAATSAPPSRSNVLMTEASPENQLLQVRLGIASSLFTALRAKHADTAAHSLRVTLGCAAWALVMDLSDEQRDVLEVAALLHDIGKIGVPDSVLLKPGALTADEIAIMDQHRRIGVEILRSSCSSQAILDIVANSSAWYAGKPDATLKEHEIPLGARMLSIVDAFDAMTSDQAYRRALPRDKALDELHRFAGKQFDPELVKLFTRIHECDQFKLHELVARRWLEALEVDRVHSPWKLNLVQSSVAALGPEAVFQQKLLDNMRDAVVFIDAGMRIMLWNPGAERMTGISGAGVFQRQFLPSIMDMRDGDGVYVTPEECPVTYAIRTGEQLLRRLIVRGRGDRDVSIDAHIVPVMGGQGITLGATLLMRDVSPELSLEARVNSLHEMATKDPLTRVANRAEFNRMHQMFVSAHLERKLPCCLMIADLDHFKNVNDTYGHPAGDEVLKSFAKVLKSHCRPGDLVARYGGEEFVMLCADCDNPTAARRAEEIRKAISDVPQDVMESKNVTASFGVTEVQPGDTPATMLARADRALYEAKGRGRNTVVQLGSGLGGEAAASEAVDVRPKHENLLAEQNLLTSVPMSVAIEKLRGFVADQEAEIVSIDGGQLKLKIGEGGIPFLRRSGDRKVPFLMDLHFTEEKGATAEGGGAGASRTRIHAFVSPQRNRDRRRTDTAERARELMASLRSYLMATEVPLAPEPAIAKRAKNLFPAWWKRK